MQIAEEIKSLINSALKELGIDLADVKIELEHPADLAHGDYSCNIAMQLAKVRDSTPHQLAESIVDVLPEHEYVSKVEIAGPGFINFYLSEKFFTDALQGVLAQGEKWGSRSTLGKERIMTEYTDPNPFKAFHIGHLMSNAIGESISRLLEFEGASVVRANYQGDIGPHVAKAIWGVQQLGIDPGNADMLGKAYAHGATAYKEDKAAKADIDEINKKIYEKSDEEINKIYDAGRKASLEHFGELYKKLGTKFDHYFFESEVWQEGKKLVEEHADIFPESEGARVFRGEEHGLHTRVFLNSEGLPTYEAKELGLQKQKMEREPEADKLLIVTGSEITEYFKVLKKAFEAVYPDIAKKVVHIPHGMMRLASGKMSSRTGEVISGEDLLADVEARVHERAPDTEAEKATQIAVAALKYAILKQNIARDSVFDEERALSLEGDSGPYLQYTHARCRSVLVKADERSKGPFDLSSEKLAVSEVERLLYRFPEIVARAAHEYEPHYVATYLAGVASAFNSWYAKEQILDGSEGESYKLAITEAVATTLKNGLWLLGIEAPEKM